VIQSRRYTFLGIVFFGLITAEFASETLDALVDASANFAAGIQQQLAAVQGESSPVEFAKKTIAYAKAKVSYITALRDAMRELTNIATGMEVRPSELDRFAGAFSLAGEKQENLADEETAVLLKRFSGNPDVEKARAEFDRAQKMEEQFHRDYDGVDFTRVVGGHFYPFPVEIGKAERTRMAAHAF
jgi:hypothetical protein